MKRKLTIFLTAAVLAAISGTAAAHDRVSFGISIGAPAYVAPPPVYYTPPPVYYAPPQVYYAPAPWRYSYYHRDWDRRAWHRHHRERDRHGR